MRVARWPPLYFIEAWQTSWPPFSQAPFRYFMP